MLLVVLLLLPDTLFVRARIVPVLDNFSEICDWVPYKVDEVCYGAFCSEALQSCLLLARVFCRIHGVVMMEVQVLEKVGTLKERHYVGQSEAIRVVSFSTSGKGGLSLIDC